MLFKAESKYITPTYCSEKTNNLKYDTLACYVLYGQANEPEEQKQGWQELILNCKQEKCTSWFHHFLIELLRVSPPNSSK